MNESSSMPDLLRPFVRQATILLKTKKRDGSWVDRPVNIVVRGENAYIRTYAEAGKSKRIRNFPEVRLCPSTFRGRPTGEMVTARARLLDGEEAREAGKLLARKHRVLHGIVVPLAHRLMRNRTLHYELSGFSSATR